MKYVFVLITLAPLVCDLISAAIKRKTERELDEWARKMNEDDKK